jgi:hypothetical protein
MRSRAVVTQETLLTALHLIAVLTAGWSSCLRSRLRNQMSRFRILVASRGLCDEHYTCSRIIAVYIYYYQDNLYMYDLCMFIRYLVSITQVLKHS